MHNWISQLSLLLSGPLPGSSAHAKMSPSGRGNTEDYIKSLPIPPKTSAIMVLLFPDGPIIRMVLIKRPDYLGVHSGQISFPGGKFEEADADFSITALRETEEEVGVHANSIQILGALSRIYIPPSNFLVYPFIGYCQDLPKFKLDKKEVERIILPPLTILKDDSIIKQGSFMAGGSHGFKISAPYYEIEHEKVWGATAAILSELKEMINLIKAE